MNDIMDTINYIISNYSNAFLFCFLFLIGLPVVIGICDFILDVLNRMTRL